MKKEDPRITRTKEIIHQAFITTLEKQDYDDITVQDILNNAKINRSTFYKHYLNKDHLATDIIEKLKNKSLIPLLEERFSTPTLEFAIKAAPVINTLRHTLQTLWKIDTHRISLKRQIQEEVKKKYIDVISTRKSLNDIDAEFQGKLFATLSIAMMEHVVMSDNPVNPMVIQTNLQEVLSYFSLE
ncbi:TetR/AcrR family transcriptional regulator [Mannheimia bovis]|uniref:TetR family transcriptional regulator n=1 Tax=Mannheimia bovis TaxID=2770636 RepID=A0A7H1BZU8_9PAST|nr:TetR/AcrR family transcriptional regulator [Mannheimia bovis]QNS14253.1 TetR family transcriptional regulator [Mannheimia bovis]